MKILIFGSNGLVGSSLKMELPNILSDVSITSSTRKDTDLFSLQETKFIKRQENEKYMM